ncbi:hypothetical protein JQ580_33390 [Bradyrhizobium japonicum]|uniref:hypothetical protein n=1 Tax=Bradyrhizobium japonicum TaxID=375 RepID=UPI001BAD72DA|nr:hypothetical protein [Bradyrhizobium japonicum]MBR0995610.1 hypothetical protein [Bradyrhizobium japonicum]
MSNSNVIDFPEATKPPPTFETVRTVVDWCGDRYDVQTTLDRTTGRGFQIVVEAKSRMSVIVRPCGLGDDPRIVEAAIVAWRAGGRRGRQQMCDEIKLPELQ